MTSTKPATLRRVVVPSTDMRETPTAAALRGKAESQLVYGEAFYVDAVQDGWCRGTALHDGYAGYVDARHLAPVPANAQDARHVVTAARAHVYAEATLKSQPLAALSFGSRLRMTGEEQNGYARLTEDGVIANGWIYAKNIGTVDAADEDYISTARRFLETPYYWGGRSGFGIDCSGLVQVCLARAGLRVPRDTEQQIELGQEHPRPRSGDLVFFKGHVGIMTDADNIIHANAHHMKVTEEPLWSVEDRTAGGITAIRRI